MGIITPVRLLCEIVTKSVVIILHQTMSIFPRVGIVSSAPFVSNCGRHRLRLAIPVPKFPFRSEFIPYRFVIWFQSFLILFGPFVISPMFSTILEKRVFSSPYQSTSTCLYIHYLFYQQDLNFCLLQEQEKNF